MKLLIIGNGFTGSKLKQMLPGADVADIHPDDEHTISFDYKNENDWEILDEYSHIVFTCKIDCSEKAAKLSQKLKAKKVILLSTAKAFHTTSADETISESSSLVHSLRNSAESFFSSYADILHLGLIWGGKRQPEKWIKSSKIKNGNKLVNFIHVDDLSKVIINLLRKDEQKGRLLVSDGQPLSWNSLAEKFNVKLPIQNCGPESKKIDNQKLLSILPKNFKFTLP